MKSDDLEFDSEDEIDPAWLRIKTQQVFCFSCWSLIEFIRARLVDKLFDTQNAGLMHEKEIECHGWKRAPRNS